MTAPPQSPEPAAAARRLNVEVFADTAALTVLLCATITIPLIFSIALPDVFALPKTILAVGLGGVLAVLLTIRWIALGRPVRRPRSPLSVALVVFVVWNLVAAWLAIDRTHALVGERLQYQGLAVVLTYVVFLVAAWTTLRDPRRRALFLGSVAVASALVAIYALMQRAGLDPIWPTLPHDRVFSTIGQANALAAYFVLAAPLVIGLAAGQRVGAQVVVAGILALMLVALAFTLSRGGYLGLAAVASVLAWAAWPRRQKVLSGRRLAAAALLGILALALVLAVPGVQAAAQRVAARALLTADLSESSIRSHLDLWTVGAAIAADHPVVGAGQDSYVLLFGEYRDHVLSPERAAVMDNFRPESPHNVYLATVGGAGLPALVAALVIVGAIAGRLIPLVRTAIDPKVWLVGAALLAAVAGHLVTDAFMTAETAGSVLFWMVLGVGAALSPGRQAWAAASARADLRGGSTGSGSGGGG